MTPRDAQLPAEGSAAAADLAAMRAWIEAELAPLAERFDAEERLPAPYIEAMGRAGLLGSAVEARYGGAGLDPHGFGALCEALGRASASALSLLTVHSMVEAAVARLGSAAQRASWLPRLASGACIAAFALSEPQAGSDAAAVETVFRRAGDSILVEGEKCWISFGQSADLFLVVGKLDGRIAALLVPRETRGLRAEPVTGLFGFRAGMLANLTFEACEVAEDHLIGASDFGLSQIAGFVLDQGRYCIAWGAVGLAQACLEASVAEAERRTQFGRPIAEFQLVQAMIADMMCETQAARLMCADAARARAAHSPDAVVRTSAAKYLAARTADRAAGAALQLHGARGLAGASAVQRYLRDAKVINLIEGSTQIQQVVLAQHGRMWADTVREFGR